MPVSTLGVEIFMSIDRQILFISLLWGGSFLAIRNILWGIKELYLSKHERKRRKQGQTFKEWFLYSRYRNEIPKILIWLYFTVLIIHPISFVCVCIAFFVESWRKGTYILTIAILVFDLIWIFLIFLLSWKPGSPWVHYEQWIPKPPKDKKK